MKFLSLLAVGVTVVGCGGTSFIGAGEDAGVGGSAGKGGTAGTGASSGQGGGAVGGGGSGGTAMGGSGGGDPCSGRPCGASCNTCPPGQTCPDVEMFCDASGSCGITFRYARFRNASRATTVLPSARRARCAWTAAALVLRWSASMVSASARSRIVLHRAV